MESVQPLRVDEGYLRGLAKECGKMPKAMSHIITPSGRHSADRYKSLLRSEPGVNLSLYGAFRIGRGLAANAFYCRLDLMNAGGRINPRNTPYLPGPVQQNLQQIRTARGRLLQRILEKQRVS
jgi:hypothetical protein